MKNITASERASLIKLASAMPKNSEDRKVILSHLKKSSLNWQLLTGSALEKVIRVFGTQFPNIENLEGSLYALKIGRKTVFARDSGVIRLYAAGDDGQIYVLKSYSALRGISLREIQILTSAAAVGMTEEAIAEGVYTNGRLST